MLKTIFILFLTFFLISKSSFGQQKYYEDVFFGNVATIGLAMWDSTYFILNNYGSSNIHKAFLVVAEQSFPSITKDVFLNNRTVTLSKTTRQSNFKCFYDNQSTGSNESSYIHVVDVTDCINSDTISFYSPIHSSIDSNYIYLGFSLIILFDNPLLQKINFSLWLKNDDEQLVNSLTFNSLNPIDTLSDTALSLSFSHLTSAPLDGSFVAINSIDIGLARGPDEFNINASYGNILGQFYFVNGSIIAIGDDSADSLINDSDVLADISSYVNQYDTLFNVSLTYEDVSASQFSYTSNPLWSTILTYTTPCDTFSVSTPNDTTVCYGTQLQLNVTGGQKYEWLPSTGLSCDTCANPIFTADSTMHYTVRIWNNDSCSVVHPLQILVSQPKIENVLFTAPDCGAPNGQLVLEASSFNWLPVSYSIDNGALQTDSFFVNLAEGNYLLRAEDSLGCFADTLVFLQDVNNTVAQFNTTAGSTEVPVTVWGENTSQYADSYAWWVDGVFFSNSEDILPVFNATGTHTIELIAWQYDPNCADTAFTTFVIQHRIIVPTAFTPDGDGNNDFWEILYLDEVYPENQVFVYNRWGDLVYQSDKGDYSGRPWRGHFENLSSQEGNQQGDQLPVGSYFYVIETGVSATLDNLVSSDKDFLKKEADKLKGSVSVIRM